MIIADFMISVKTYKNYFDDFLTSGPNAAADAVEWCTRKCRIKRKSVGHQAGPWFLGKFSYVVGPQNLEFFGWRQTTGVRFVYFFCELSAVGLMDISSVDARMGQRSPTSIPVGPFPAPCEKS